MTRSKGKGLWQITSKPLFWGLIALLLLFFAQRQAEMDLFSAWQTEEYSHGMLIPLIALLLAWHRLTEIKPNLRPSWLGIGFILVAGALQLIAQLSAFSTVAEYGLVLALIGISLAFLGRQATVAMAPAFFYLIFAIPLPHLVQANLSEDLQLLSSTLGVDILDLFGVPVFQQGNVIDLGGYRLQVVEACSGLRYLFPLMSFGFLAAYLLEDRLWKRLFIFLSTIPITIIMNSLRIAFIGVTVDLWGEKMAEGFVHSFEGWTVFMICIALLMAEVWIFLRIGSKGQFRYVYLGLARGTLFGRESVRKAPWITALLCTLLLAIIFGSGLIEHRTEIIPSRPQMATFPLELGDWRGRQNSLAPDVLDALQLSDYWLADYKRPKDTETVNFYMAYYATQHVGSMTHSPSNCIPGGGWQIENSRVETIQLADGSPIRLTRLLIREGDEAELVYYWFDERGHDITETSIAKWYLLWDSIFMHRTDGSLIRLVTPLAHGEDEAVAEKRLNDFLNIVNGEIKVFIPGAI